MLRTNMGEKSKKKNYTDMTNVLTKLTESIDTSRSPCFCHTYLTPARIVFFNRSFLCCRMFFFVGGIGVDAPHVVNVVGFHVLPWSAHPGSPFFEFLNSVGVRLKSESPRWSQKGLSGSVFLENSLTQPTNTPC